jgi:hypothetical protein
VTGQHGRSALIEFVQRAVQGRADVLTETVFGVIPLHGGINIHQQIGAGGCAV